MIIELINETTSNRVSFDNLTIASISKNETIKVNNLNGQLLKTINDVNNKEKVSLNNLPKGVYFVTTKTQSAKIIVD